MTITARGLENHPPTHTPLGWRRRCAPELPVCRVASTIWPHMRHCPLHAHRIKQTMAQSGGDVVSKQQAVGQRGTCVAVYCMPLPLSIGDLEPAPLGTRTGHPLISYWSRHTHQHASPANTPDNPYLYAPLLRLVLLLQLTWRPIPSRRDPKLLKPQSLLSPPPHLEAASR